MTHKEGSRRNHLTLAAVEPADGTMGEVMVSFDRMHAVAKRSMGQAKECGFIVPMILQQPTAVFEGLRQDADEDKKGYGWLCYLRTSGACLSFRWYGKISFSRTSLLGFRKRSASGVQLEVGKGRCRRF